MFSKYFMKHQSSYQLDGDMWIVNLRYLFNFKQQVKMVMLQRHMGIKSWIMLVYIELFIKY